MSDKKPTPLEIRRRVAEAAAAVSRAAWQDAQKRCGTDDSWQLATALLKSIAERDQAALAALEAGGQ